MSTNEFAYSPAILYNFSAAAKNMSRTKETRRQVLESGSPLRHHSLNQYKLKSGNEGEERVSQTNHYNLPQEEIQTNTPQEIIQELSSSNLPLTRDFLEVMLPTMIQQASFRIDEEEKKVTPVPVRIFRIITDVQKTYRIAKQKGIHLQMVDTQLFVQDEQKHLVNFPTYLDHTRYPELFSFLNYLNVLNKRFERNVGPNSAYPEFYKALRLNLTSCDFSLPPKDQLLERVKVYTYIIANVALTVRSKEPNRIRDERLDTVFVNFLEDIKTPLLKK